MPDNSRKASKIALSGILGALAVICLFFASILPTSRLSLYALSSFFICIVIIENGIKAGWFFYAATTLLAVILVPDKLSIIPYAIFFGAYGAVKYYIEKINRLLIEYIVKYIFFNICLAAAVLFIWQIFAASVKINLPWWILIVVLEIVFFIYDYVYSMVIAYYRDNLRKKLRL